MSTDTFTIARARFVSLLGSSSYPNPDDDSPIWRWPHGPGPVARSWLDVLSRIALNPQPLPPKQFFAAAVAGVALERADRVAEIAGLLPEQERTLSVRFSAEMGEFDEWCGTMSRWELLQKLLNWLKHHNPPPPPPDPWWTEKLTQNEIIVIGGRIAYAADGIKTQTVRATLQNMGARLIEKNLAAGVTAGGRSPALEQV